MWFLWAHGNKEGKYRAWVCTSSGPFYPRWDANALSLGLRRLNVLTRPHGCHMALHQSRAIYLSGVQRRRSRLENKAWHRDLPKYFVDAWNEWLDQGAIKDELRTNFGMVLRCCANVLLVTELGGAYRDYVGDVSRKAIESPHSFSNQGLVTLE